MRRALLTRGICSSALPLRSYNSRRGSHAPVSVEHPRALLAFLAAVLGPPAPSALGKLPGELLPLAALVVGTLPYAASGVILAAKVAHHDPGPVLHVLAVVPDSELLNQREDVEVVRLEVFLLLRVAC